MSKAKIVTLRKGEHAGDLRAYGFNPGSQVPDPSAAFTPAEDKGKRHGEVDPVQVPSPGQPISQQTGQYTHPAQPSTDGQQGLASKFGQPTWDKVQPNIIVSSSGVQSTAPGGMAQHQQLAQPNLETANQLAQQGSPNNIVPRGQT